MKLFVLVVVVWCLVQGYVSAIRDSGKYFFPHSATYRRIGGCKPSENHLRCIGSRGQPDGICLIDYKNTRRGPACIAARTENFQFTMEVKYLPKSKKSQGDKLVKRLFIRGTGPGLSQTQSIQLSKSARNVHTWTTVISYASDSSGLKCMSSDHCSLNQGTMQFRLYLDDSGKQGMLGPDFVIHLPVSRSLSESRQFLTPKVAIYPWFNQNSSTVKHIKQTISLEDDKKIHVQATLVYPPSYNENTFKRYKLVLLLENDKHYIPQVDYLSSHIGLIDELVLLLLSPSEIAWGTSQQQGNHSFLLPFDTYSMECGSSNMEQCIKCHRCHDTKRIEPCDKDEFIARSKRCLYLKHNKEVDEEIISNIIDHMIEAVRKEVGSNRLIFDPPGKRATVLGFGEQAVTAFILGLSKPDIFGNIGCLSPKFYLPMTAEYKLEHWIFKYIDAITRKYTDHSLPQLGCSALHISQKYYFSHGENDDINFPLGKTTGTTRNLINKLKRKFRLKDRVNIMYQVVKDQGLLYPDNSSFPLMSLLQTPLLYFHQAEGAPSVLFAPDIDTIKQYFIDNAIIGGVAKGLGPDVPTTGKNDNFIEINYRRTLDGGIEVAGDHQCTVSYDDIPLSFVLVSVGGSVVISVILVVIMMCLKEENRQAEKQKEQEEKELLEELSSDDDQL